MTWIARWVEPKHQISEERKIFNNAYLKQLILPLFIEQFLVMSVGIADTLMVSYAGEAAVSGVSLVNMFITIFIYIFTALASGGAVVVSQAIGRKDRSLSDLAASQLVTLSAVISLFSLIVTLASRRLILGWLFGSVEPAVMEASVTYLTVMTYTFPAIALYNAGAALFRSMGRTKSTMHLSLWMNGINIVGNYIGVFILRAGVAGVAWPTFISRAFAAFVIIIWCFKENQELTLRIKQIFSWHADMMKRILRIAIPNSIEQGLFQVSKVVLSSITALFGTSQIAANGVAQSFWSMAALVGVAFGPAFITIIGQTLGSKDIEAAKYYMVKLLKITILSSVVWNALMLVIVPIALMAYDLSPETKQLVIILVIIHNLFNAFVFPISSPFTNGLRAGGDVRYAMFVSIFATVVVRVILSYLFGIVFNLGVIGIALAMGVDWCVRAFLSLRRYQSGRWLAHQVI